MACGEVRPVTDRDVIDAARFQDGKLSEWIIGLPDKRAALEAIAGE